jgi:hypothetical protein
MTKTTGLSAITRIPDLPGLSPLGRVVIARLEHTRLCRGGMPGGCGPGSIR